ncbi:FKBP-type peptidyl-prolyl cis-trans isomerase [Galbibacter orientalis DSM 19592]|uniref:Peptidyl-prolyl cis-trans isomerase n=1 Tax=Galbibacter orientalis DSM 19592 TaxID=926559 RepID=I3C1R8_9FLAO|nr:FKBP-type peptidyl-prolyl cis-trans isomerase [Galbibacter orientalis]EIJ37561.1 FKBP-type peptidyl-prolyl cis-trans isomerase [Galbibacter orientalis DSM 19592]
MNLSCQKKIFLNGLLNIFLYVLIVLTLNNCKSHEESTYIQTSSGLQYRILKKGTGEKAVKGQEVLVHETMSYRNDSLLFDSRTLPNPVRIKIGASQAIDGVDEALIGMKIGEIKKLIIPPKLSKRSGEHKFPHPDSILVYKVELIDILK